MTAKNDIKYIIVETVLNKKDLPISELIKTSKTGLFKGLREETISDPNVPEMFLLLKGKDEALLSLNLNHYNILSVERFNGLSKTITYFRASEEEQVSATSVLVKLVNDFKNTENMLASNRNLIDTSKYTSVPTTFGGTSSAIKVPNTGYKETKNYNRTANTSHTSTYTPKPKKPSVIKRKSKVPTKAMLDEMEKKLKLIREGKFEAKLPDIAGDPPVEEGLDEEDYHASYFTG